MLIAITSLTKSFVALWTVVRFLASMNKQVILEGIGTIEFLATLFAIIAALTTVNQTMLVEDRSGKEALVASRTPGMFN